MFVTSVRQSNLLPSSQRMFDPTRQLVWKDVLWRSKYIKINIKWGKSQQKSTTRFQKIPCAASTTMCTYTALKRLRANRKARPHAPIISFPDEKPIPISYVNKRWKHAMTALGLDAIGFTLHSLRRGGARFLQDQGINTAQIASHGGWKSKAIYDYIRPPTLASTYSALKHMS